jgi:hypothetical protein
MHGADIPLDRRELVGFGFCTDMQRTGTCTWKIPNSESGFLFYDIPWHQGRMPSQKRAGHGFRDSRSFGTSNNRAFGSHEYRPSPYDDQRL